MLVADRYRLGGPLGRGGMGEVYRAVDQVLDRQVAIKLMRPEPNTLAASERFHREARAAAAVNDPHVVAAFDFGSHGDGYYLAMELVEGRTVSQELKQNGPLPPDRAADIIRQAAAGLAAAHRLGIVHRDIKPGNLLLASDGTVKVADFGIVRFLDDTTTTLTATGQIVGTSYYLAPERALGKPAEAAADVYALGCVLYQLVTGLPPFTAEEPVSIMYQHVATPPVPPSEVRPELAGEFERLLLWLLAKDPAQRPTAAELASGATPPLVIQPSEAVTAELALGTTASTATGDTAHAQQGERATEADATPGVTSRQPSGQRLVAAAAILAIALAAMGILFDANGLKVPVTNDLRPGSGATAPAAKVRAPVKPGAASPTATPNPSQTVAGVSTALQPPGRSSTGKSSKPSEATKAPQTQTPVTRGPPVTKEPPTKGAKTPKPSKPPKS